MPKDQKPLDDAAIRRQVQLERLKSEKVREFNTVFDEIATLVAAALATRGELSDLGVRQVRRLLFKLQKDVKKKLVKALELHTKGLAEIGSLYASFEAGDLAASIIDDVAIATVTTKGAYSFAKAQAMGHSGELLEDFVRKLAGSETNRVVGVIRRGYQQGEPNNALVRAVTGTRRLNYRDGILATSRRNAQAVVRTSIQHVASTARMKLWEANSDVVEGYEWLAVLDSRTTTICRSLDGQTFEVGKGPVPPAHVNCRSTTVPKVSEEFDFLKEGETRSSEFGPVDGNLSYYEWLKRQPAEYQDGVLGRTRAKLFRDSGLSAEAFADLNVGSTFQPLTLDQMRLLEPEAFERAGL